MKRLTISLIILLLSLLITVKVSNGKDIDDLISLIEDSSTDWKTQIIAIKKIAESSDPRGIEVLLRLINDPFLNHDCPALKFHAAEALSRYKGDSRVVETLISLASDRNNPISVREAAINSLGEIGDKKALNPIIDILNEDSFAIRMSSIRAIGKIGDSSIIDLLESLIDKEKDLKGEIYHVVNLLKAKKDNKADP